MAKVLVALANGFEEIEAITVIDVLRRAGVEVVTGALEAAGAVGSHGIAVSADRSLRDIDPTEFDAIVLPGGQPGSDRLRDDLHLRRILVERAQAGKIVAAICAAPIALEAAGLLAGKRATSFPDVSLPSADYSNDRVVEDGNVITSRAAGTAMEFALALVRRLVGHEMATTLRQRMLVTP